MPVLIKVSIAMIKHMTTGEGRVSLSLQLHSTAHPSLKRVKGATPTGQGPGGKQAPELKLWLGRELLTGLLPPACSVCFLLYPRTTYPGSSVTHSELGPPLATIKQDSVAFTPWWL